MNDDQNPTDDHNTEEGGHVMRNVAIGAAALAGAAVAGAVLSKEENRDKISDAVDTAKGKFQDMKEDISEKIDDLLRKMEDMRTKLDEAIEKNGKDDYVDLQDELDKWSEKLQSAKSQGMDNADELLANAQEFLGTLRDKLDDSDDDSEDE